MNLLWRFWTQMILMLVGLTIGTLDFLGVETATLWLEILPSVRIGLGMPPIE